MNTCEHAETTTIAWLYGEGDDGHAAHVATCPACQATTALHADVMALAAPVLPATRAPAPRRRRDAWVGLSVLAAAAAVALAVWSRPPPAPPTGPADDALAAVELEGADDLDRRLDALEDQLLDLSLDLQTL